MNLLKWFAHLYWKCVEGDAAIHQTIPIADGDKESGGAIIVDRCLKTITDKMTKCTIRDAEFIVTGRRRESQGRYEVTIHMEPGAISIREDKTW